MKKINVNNKEKVNSFISEIESKAKQRLMQSYEHILIDIEKAETRLKELNIPKKYWQGCLIHIEPPRVPNSYKYRAEGTKIIVERFKSGWFVVACYRTQCKKEPYGGPMKAILYLSKIAKQAIPFEYQI